MRIAAYFVLAEIVAVSVVRCALILSSDEVLEKATARPSKRWTLFVLGLFDVVNALVVLWALGWI